MKIKDSERTKAKKQVLKVFDNLRKVINRQGIETTNLILRDGIKYCSDSEKHLLIVNNIIHIVISDFGKLINVKKSDLTKNNQRGDVIEVRNTIFVIINRCLSLNCKKISNYFPPLSPVTVWKAVDSYKKLDKNNNIEKKVIENTERLIEKSIQLMNKKTTKIK